MIQDGNFHLNIDWKNKYATKPWSRYFRWDHYFQGVATFGGSLLLDVYVIQWQLHKSKTLRPMKRMEIYTKLDIKHKVGQG